jgi:hypothetical protein
MAALTNPKHEAFAQKIAEGISAAEAYRELYPKAAPASAETLGPALFRSVQVSFRIEELKLVQQTIIEEKFKMGREDITQFLVDVVKTPIGEVDETHWLCQEYSETSGVNGTTRKYKMPSKLDAIEKVIKMGGYYAPEKVEHSGTVTGLLQKLTGAKK